jgi:hypothetical protein
MDAYVVRPRKTRDGFNLESTVLSHGHLWYGNEGDAISYAEWNSRVKGCTIDIANASDTIVRTIKYPAGDFAY